MRLIHRVALIVGMVAVALVGTTGGAEAAGGGPTGVPGLQKSTAVTIQSSTCPATNLCVWDGFNGTGHRCTWVNQDNDWWNTPVVCSWASSRPVKSFENAGTSGNWGVAAWDGANYQGSYLLCVPQGSGIWNINPSGLSFRSHKWVPKGGICG